MSQVRDFSSEILIKRLDQQQEHLATRIGSGHRLIYGVAGSGKTLILLTRAKILAQQYPHYRILVLCYNICLSSYINSIFKAEQEYIGETKIQVRHFHEWAKEILQSEYSRLRNKLGFNLTSELGRTPSSSEIDQKYEDFLGEQLFTKLQEFPITSKWDAILIDEAHTFYPSWFKACISALKSPKTDHLLIVSDVNQKLYSRPKFTWASVGVKAQGRTYSKQFYLDQNYRNTQEILSAAWSLIEPINTNGENNDNDTFPNIQPTAFLRHGLAPELQIAESPNQEVKLVVNKIKDLQAAGYELEDIAILYKAITDRASFSLLRKELTESGIRYYWVTEDNQTKRRYSINTPGVKILTTLSSLGLEFKVVIIFWVQQFSECLCDIHEVSFTTRRQLYVAMTRAQNELYLFGSGNSSFLDYLSQLKGIKSSNKNDDIFIDNLKLQQIEFGKRIIINQFITCKLDGYHREIINIDAPEELEPIDEYCWQKVDDYKRKGDRRSAKSIYEDNMKGKLGELALKKYLGNLITSVDFSNKEYGDGGYDFSLKSNPSILLQVKARHSSNIEKIQWRITEKETNKNDVLVCIYIQDEIHRSRNSYSLIYAGFIPTNLIVKKKVVYLSISDLLYIGGLQNYLYSIPNQNHSSEQ